MQFQPYRNIRTSFIKKGELMLLLKIPKYFILSFSALLILACSLEDIQRKKEETISSQIPDCQKHYTKEGGLVSSPIYKTWVRYDQLDFKKGFDLAVKALQSHGH